MSVHSFVLIFVHPYELFVARSKPEGRDNININSLSTIPSTQAQDLEYAEMSAERYPVHTTPRRPRCPERKGAIVLPPIRELIEAVDAEQYLKSSTPLQYPIQTTSLPSSSNQSQPDSVVDREQARSVKGGRGNTGAAEPPLHSTYGKVAPTRLLGDPVKEYGHHPKECFNCLSTVTAYNKWRYGPGNSYLCNACGIYAAQVSNFFSCEASLRLHAELI